MSINNKDNKGSECKAAPVSNILATPPADIDITPQMAAALLREQHPDLAGLEIAFLSSGWDNVMFRLGSDLCLRLPRRHVSAPLLLHEQEWLPQLVNGLPLPIPSPVRTGHPSADYPWTWSVIPWHSGQSADNCVVGESHARSLGNFLRALHQPAPEGLPANPFRGIPLHTRDAGVMDRIERLRDRTDLITPRILEIWQIAMKASINGEWQSCWLHGDLHPQNILVDGDQVTAVIDWGDMTAGDPATDLAAAWMLFDDERHRQVFLDLASRETGANEPKGTEKEDPVGRRRLIERAAGWALLFGVSLLDTGLVNNPGHAAIGRKTLKILG